ncbi:MAG TPA: HAD family hydrolase [Acidiferrobacteraceae bacterium]|nr:HAD family hydrolase [Acidiferrobacteraceae bacterium]
MSLEALLFDVDGTLADTERDGHRIAYNAAFAEVGLDWDWTVSLYGELLAITGGKERILHFIEMYRPDFQRPKDLKGYIADMHDIKTRHFTQLVRRGGIAPRPGVKRLLFEARQAGLRLAIATTTTPENVQALLSTSFDGAEDWFEVIGAGDVVPSKKPAPDIYNYVMKKMALSSDSCLALEDSFNGLRSSLAAGVQSVITYNAYTQDHDFSDAALVVDHLGEPDTHCQVSHSRIAINGAAYVDLALLKRLHGAR